MAGEEQVDERARALVGPGLGQRRRPRPPAGRASRGRSACSPAAAAAAGAQHQARVGGRVGVGGEVDLAVAQHEPGADRPVAPRPPARTGRCSDASIRCQASSLRQAMVRAAAATVCIARRPTPRRAPSATASCSSSSSRSPGRPVRRWSSTRAESSVVVGRPRARVVALPQQAAGRLGPAQGVHVAQAAAALLQVGLEQEGHLAGRVVALAHPARQLLSHRLARFCHCSSARRARSSVRSASPARCRTWSSEVAVSRSSAARARASLVRADGVAELQRPRPRSGTRADRRGRRCRRGRRGGAGRRCRTAGSARPGRSRRPRRARRRRRRTRPRRAASSSASQSSTRSL